MSIVDRLWSREAPTPEKDLSLAQRLKDLAGTPAPEDSKTEASKPAAANQAAPARSDEPQAAAVAAVDGKSGTAAQPAKAPPEEAKSSSDATDGDRRQQEKSMENSSAEVTESKDNAERASQEGAPASPESKGPGRQFLDRFHAAVGRTESAAEKSPATAKETPPEFQTIQKQFEADFRKRLDGALAEFERRVSSQALIDDISGQIEQRIRLAADGIFKEVKNQAWMMHSAVAGELRSFRDQFGKEIEERVGMLDRAAQQAQQLKEKIEAALPKAEDTLRSLSVFGQEVTAKLEEGSNDLAERLHNSHEELVREVEAQREALQALAQGLRQEGSQLQEQMEKFRGEAGAACDVLGRTTDQSLERLGAAAAEVDAHTREGLEKLATEIERRILSGGLVEKATERLGKATQEMVEPSLERIRKASQGADAAATSLSGTGQRVAEQLDAARQQIEARLDSLLGEQLNVLEGAMSGFQRKASEELGSLVERVVAQSTDQLDERLHGLLQDLFANTSQQIHTAARATLNNMHDGLKEAFKPQTGETGTDTRQSPADE